MSWIKVKDRLPEGGTSALAMTNEGDYVVVFYSATDKHWHTDGIPCLPLVDDFIVAWCEIAEPNFVSDDE